MKRTTYTITAAAAMLLSTTVKAQSIIGITTDDKLFTIADPTMPGTITTPASVTGLTAGQTIVGTDFRPNTGELYALGYNSTTGDAQLYTINVSTAVATSVGAALTLELGSGSVGFDFNPTVDRIRVTAANRKNYRLHPVTGAIAAIDGDLAFATTDINASSMPMIGASAYTNSYIGTESTTLFNYDEGLNIITTQVPPNDGTQNTVGSSGIIIDILDKSVDMDIYFDAATSTNTAYLAANTLLSDDQLYTVNLTTGAATSVGLIGSGLEVKDIAVTIDRSLPEVTGQMVYALTKTNSNFISFDSENPGIIRGLRTISGITTGQTVVGMDFRPENRQLYAMGYNYTNMEYQLYTMDTETGVATAVNTTAGTIDLGSFGNVGFDFNPVPDRIRVVSASNGNNYRLNPTDGMIAATDTALTFAEGDVNVGTTPYIGSVAYTNSYKGATATLLHGLDDSTGTLVSIAPPNAGTVNTLMEEIIMVNMADASYDMDIYYDSTSTSNMVFLAAHAATGMFDNFHSINLTSGAVTDLGSIGFGIPVRDIAIRIDYTNSVTSVGNVKNNKAPLTVYPNPTKDVLYFNNLVNVRNAFVTIADLSGRVISNTTITNNTVDVANLSKGMYIISVTADGKAYAPAKFVKE